MNKDDAPRVSVIINAHAENPFWLRRAIKSVLMQHEPPDFELLIVCDKATHEVDSTAHEFHDHPNVRIFSVDYGDLGESRNHCIKIGPEEGARGKYIAFLDGDDCFGNRWLRQAYEMARVLERPDAIGSERFMLHPEINVFFGAQYFFHRHIGDDSPEFDAKDMLQYNAWSALAFAPRSVFAEFPYARSTGGFGFEDHDINTRTLGAGVAHRVVPGSAHMIRLKHDDTSMAKRFDAKNLAIRKQALFDRRDLPNATAQPPERRELPREVVEQIVFAHREVGERQIVLNRNMPIRMYPHQLAFNEMAWLRDAIGDAKRVVLVDNMHRGGAEKYAIDFAKATGATIVETRPAPDSPWRKRATDAGVKLVTWKKITPNLQPEEHALALQRALIQCELESVLICNSSMGWMLVHINAEVLAKRVLCASFAAVPMGMGMEGCPPFHVKHPPPNLSILTDNEAHATKIREFNGLHVIVVRPKCTYSGPSKRSQITKKQLRVLWAGRGTPEKNPGILPAVATILGERADIHVWGDVKPMNGPENLKYRGPFDGFESIDGSYDVYLNTSLTEGMPNTAMEAVMADIPVVGPDVGGLEELATTLCELNPTSVAQAVLSAGTSATHRVTKAMVMQWTNEFDERARAISGFES